MQTAARIRQFSLAALMQMVTICAVLFALARLIGPTASVCLALMAGALAMRQGLAAVFALGAALLAVESYGQTVRGSGFLGLTLVYIIATALCHWFRERTPRPTR